jgi:hypothetical protein
MIFNKYQIKNLRNRRGCKFLILKRRPYTRLYLITLFLITNVSFNKTIIIKKTLRKAIEKN